MKPSPAVLSLFAWLVLLAHPVPWQPPAGRSGPQEAAPYPESPGCARARAAGRLPGALLMELMHARGLDGFRAVDVAEEWGFSPSHIHYARRVEQWAPWLADRVIAGKLPLGTAHKAATRRYYRATGRTPACNLPLLPGPHDPLPALL